VKRELALALCLAMGASAGVAETTYRARKGDTLWDLSARFFQDAREWPELWALNPHFPNPHWISPGDPIFLRLDDRFSVRLPLVALPPGELEHGGGAPAAEEAREDALSRESEAGGSDSTVSFSKQHAQDFIATRRVAPMGVVRNRTLVKELYTAGEDVEVDLSGAARLSAGDLATVYDDSERVVHPTSQRFLGYHVRVLGQARIVSVSGDRAIAKLEEAYDSIGNAARLMPYRVPLADVRPSAAPRPFDGVLLQGAGGKTLFGARDVVFLDRGSLHGLNPGALLDVPLFGERKPAQGLVELTEPVARIIVLAAEDKTATGLVLESRMALSAGERFRRP
jgi:hypothetical protein